MRKVALFILISFLFSCQKSLVVTKWEGFVETKNGRESYFLEIVNKKQACLIEKNREDSETTYYEYEYNNPIIKFKREGWAGFWYIAKIDGNKIIITRVNRSGSQPDLLLKKVNKFTYEKSYFSDLEDLYHSIIIVYPVYKFSYYDFIASIIDETKLKSLYSNLPNGFANFKEPYDIFKITIEDDLKRYEKRNQMYDYLSSIGLSLDEIGTKGQFFEHLSDSTIIYEYYDNIIVDKEQALLNMTKLYNNISPVYNIGSFNVFSEKMKDESKRRVIYDVLKKDGYSDLGSYYFFNAKLGFGKQYKESFAYSKEEFYNFLISDFRIDYQ